MIKDLNYYMSLPYTLVFYLDEDDDVVAYVKELRGCSSHGSTYNEACINIKETMEEYISFSLEKALPIQEPVLRK